MGKIILVTGGVRSGKSAFAERYAMHCAASEGARVAYIDGDFVINPTFSQIEKADIVASCNINFSRPLMKAAKDAGKTIATDVHVLSNIYGDYNREFLEYADIIFLSDENLPSPREEFLTALKSAYGMKIIVMGCGADGALLYERAKDEIAHFPAAKPERIVNTVGAGDALFSCFIHFYAGGMDAENALHYAQHFAAIKIGTDGAAKGFVDETALKNIKL